MTAVQFGYQANGINLPVSASAIGVCLFAVRVRRRKPESFDAAASIGGASASARPSRAFEFYALFSPICIGHSVLSVRQFTLRISGMHSAGA
jgi:hypothetical protein